MAVNLETKHLVLNGQGNLDNEYTLLEDAIDRADFLSQPEHSVAEHAYIVTAIKVTQAA